MPSVRLSVGAYGAEVSRLQHSLAEQGFSIAASEVNRRFFGPATRQALHLYQKTHGLEGTGAVDAATAAALAGGSSASASPHAAAVSASAGHQSRPTAVGAPGDMGAGPQSITRHPAHPHEGDHSGAKGYNEKFNEIAGAEGVPPPPASVANYLPYRIVGNQLLLSGQAPFFGRTLKYTGKVGDSVSIDDARAAARLTGLNLLYVAQEALGTLDRVQNVIELEGMVNCTSTFNQQSKVIDGCSDLMVEVFGSEHGKHVRSAVGQVALVADITVEIKVSFEIDESTLNGAKGSRTVAAQRN